jgi:hypothetical protein
MQASEIAIWRIPMRHRVVGLLGTVALTVVALGVPARVAGQAPSGTKTFDPTAIDPGAAIKAAADEVKKASATKNWTAPRTAWGDPDLQGYYFNHSGYTPLERPAALAGKEFYTEEEALAAFKKAVEADAEVDPRTVHYDWKEYGMDAWQMNGVRPNLRTSLIVDPPDGKIPPLTPEAQKRLAAAAAASRARGVDVTTPGLYTRCITGNGGPPRIPGGVTAESQIVQTPGYVVMISQSNNDVRIIPLDGRPHLPKTVGQWLGDARGHWEGTTLVVETTNFTQRNWRGSNDGMHLVERFTLVGPKTLRYQFTVNDPTTWTRPWSIDSLIPMIDPPIYEFACHEQNYGLINWTTGSQVTEKAAAQGGQTAQPAREER